MLRTSDFSTSGPHLANQDDADAFEPIVDGAQSIKFSDNWLNVNYLLHRAKITTKISKPVAL